MVAFVWIPFAIICLWFAFKVARWVQKSIDEEKKRSANGKPKSNSYGWIAHIHWIIGALGGIGAAIKFAYRSWKEAPVGSATKLGWEALVALLFCLGLWFIFRYIDSKLYGDESPNYTKIDHQASQRAIQQMGEQVDSINR